MKLEISLAPETVFHLGSFPVTNSFLLMIIVTVFLIVFAIVITRSLKPVPKGWQNIVELLIEGGRDFIRETIGDEKKTMKVFPLVFTLFIFILTSNLINFIPVQQSLFINNGLINEAERIAARIEKGSADYTINEIEEAKKQPKKSKTIIPTTSLLKSLANNDRNLGETSHLLQLIFTNPLYADKLKTAVAKIVKEMDLNRQISQGSAAGKIRGGLLITDEEDKAKYVFRFVL